MEEEEPTLQKGGLDVAETLSCPDHETFTPSCVLGALYWACFHNDTAQLQAMLDDGVSPEEATQVDSNGRVSYPGCFTGQQGALCVLTTPHSSLESLRVNSHSLGPQEEGSG